MVSIVQGVLNVCQTIDSPRTIHTVFDHMLSEVHELEMEFNSLGEDGVIGEAVDVILCALDVIYQDNPNVTEDDIARVVERKLTKWVRLYGNQTKEI